MIIAGIIKRNAGKQRAQPKSAFAEKTAGRVTPAARMPATIVIAMMIQPLKEWQPHRRLLAGTNNEIFRGTRAKARQIVTIVIIASNRIAAAQAPCNDGSGDSIGEIPMANAPCFE